mgnify:CR=1 FL=1
MPQPILIVENLHVEVDGRRVLRGINLTIGEGEVHAIMGQNASGKTTLALTLAGFPQYKVVNGRIVLDGIDITYKPINERAKLGLAVAFQNPPAIRGIKLRDVIRLCMGIKPWNPIEEPEEKYATPFLRVVGLEPERYLHRDLNVGFSGGERKRSELAQVFAMKPKVMVLDEPDSGVDVDSLKLLGTSIKKYIEENRCAVLIITHHRHILQYLKPSLVHVIHEGVIALSGIYEEIVPQIEAVGYAELISKISQERERVQDDVA